MHAIQWIGHILLTQHNHEADIRLPVRVGVGSVSSAYQCGHIGRDQLDCVAATRNKAHHSASNGGEREGVV